MLRKLERNDFDKIFEIMEKSFPKDEYRTYEGQKALLEEKPYTIYILTGEQDIIKGFIAVWEYDEFGFVEHLAVDPQYRNEGLGSIMLKETSKMLSKMLCLEVELPETEISQRRIGFYRRNGFFLNEYPYIQPALAEGQEPVPLLIMTTQKELDIDEFIDVKTLLYSKVYKVME